MPIDAGARGLAKYANSAAGISAAGGALNNGAYNFDRRYLNKTAAMKADVRLGAANGLIICPNDSITHGWTNGSSGLQTTAWPTLLKKQLIAAGVPAETDSFFGTGGEASLADYVTYDPRISYTTGWVPSSVISVGGFGWANATNSNALSFLVANAWDSCEAWVSAGTGGCTVSLDVGGTATEFVIPASFTRISEIFAAGVPGAAGSPAVQTVNIKRVSGASLTVFGVHVWDSTTKRIAIFNMGRSGWTSTNWNDTSNTARPLTAYNTIAAGAMGGVKVLTISSLGINDRGGGGAGAIGIPTYTTNMDALWTAFKLKGDLLAHIPPPTLTSTTSQAIQDEYDNVLRTMALQKNVPYVDLPRTWGYYTGALAAGLMGANAVHETIQGNDNIAQLLFNVIMRV